MIVGLDEAGRGAWAGPLVAAAVYLPEPMPGLRDSKLMSAKGRETLYELIVKQAKVGVGLVSNLDIDKHGLSWAQRQAMAKAVEDLAITGQRIVIDGPIDYLGWFNSTAKVDADAKYPAVMAASIVAKVHRDRLMTGLEELAPGYGFAKHKGYGTKAHVEALVKLGVCRHHRISYKPVGVFA